MQAVGRSCEECGEKIRSALEGSACGACRVAYHHECLEEPEDCPECGVAFGAREKASEDAAAAASWRLMQRGRLFVGAGCASIFGVHLVLNYFFVQLQGFDVESAFVAKILVRVLLLGALLWATFIGKRWARMLLACLLLLGVTIAAANLGGAGTLGLVLLGAVAAADVAGLVAIFVPSASRAYLAERERQARRLVEA